MGVDEILKYLTGMKERCERLWRDYKIPYWRDMAKAMEGAIDLVKSHPLAEPKEN